MMYSCKYCDFTTENPKSLANHIRWTHLCPEYSNERKEFSNKILKLNLEKKSQKEENQLETRICYCIKCGKPFEQTLRKKDWNNKKKVKECCSSFCAHSRTKTEESRLKLRKTWAEKYGKDVSKALEPKVCPICKTEFFGRTTCCSRSCALKLRYRINKEIEKNRQYTLKEYRKKCKFSFSLKNYPDEFDFSLIEENGWYAPSNSSRPNLYGVSRDHMFSVKDGWKNNISPDIISHPANCKLLKHSDNSSKSDSSSIFYEELLERIEKWNKKYNEDYRIL